MKIVTVLAQKGGAGKTTLSVHWAVEAERQGFGPVALVDIDPQGSSRSWAERRRDKLGSFEPLTIKADQYTLNENNVSLDDVISALKNEGINTVIIDTTPRVEEACVDVAEISDFVVIPCGPSILDIEAISASVDIVHGFGVNAGVVINQARPNSLINLAAASKIDAYQLQICPTHIVRRASMMDALMDGKVVSEWLPKDKSAQAEIANSWVWIAYQMERKGYEQRRKVS